MNYYVGLAIVTVVVLGAAAVIARLRNHRQAAPSVKAKQGRPEPAQQKTEAMRLPYRYAFGSLFVRGNTVWTGVKLAAQTDEFLSQDELLGMVDAATRAIQGLVTGKINVQYRLTHRPFTADAWAEEAISHCFDPTPDHVEYLRATGRYLAAMGAARPEAYLFVPVATVAARAGVADRVDARLIGVADELFTPKEVAQWGRLATEVHEKLRMLGVVPATRDDLLWLLKKTLHGHLTPLPVEFGKSRPWGPGEFQLAVDFDGRNHRTHIEITQINDDPDSADSELGAPRKSYWCGLTVAEWPDEMPFEHETAWLRVAARLPGQVEVTYWQDLLPVKEFADAANKIAANLTDEIRDIRKTGREPSASLSAQSAQANQLVADIDTQKLPGVRGQIMFGVAAGSVEEMERLARDVIQTVKEELDVVLVRPTRYQWRMLQAFLPGNVPDAPIVPFVRLHEASLFGIGLPTAGADLGDNPVLGRDGRTRLGWVGQFIGWSRGLTTHYTMPVGPSRNSGAGVAIFGASGGGKSNLALLKFYQESEAGARCVAIDPKVDFAKFCLFLAFGSQVNEPGFDDDLNAGVLGTPQSAFQPTNRRFWDDTQIIDIVKSQDGVLDAWQVARTVNDGFTLALDLFRMLVPEELWERSVQVPVIMALDDVRSMWEARGSDDPTARPSMWKVVDAVVARFTTLVDSGASVDERNRYEVAATVLRRLREQPTARLMFAPNPKSMTTLRKRRTVFTLRGLTTPRTSDARQWKDGERYAAAVLYVTTELTSQMMDVKAERRPSGEMAQRPGILFIDEAYVVTAMDQGRDLVKKSLAQGRAYLFVIVLIDQQAGRFAQIEDDSGGAVTGNQFHSVFAFLHKTVNEARRALPLLGREQNPDVATSLLHVNNGGRLDTGVCVFRDVDGRAGTTEIDLVFAPLMAAADTNPVTRPKSQAVDYPPSPADWPWISDSARDLAVEQAQKMVEAQEDTAA